MKSTVSVERMDRARANIAKHSVDRYDGDGRAMSARLHDPRSATACSPQDQDIQLSVRAENVLKILSTDLTGENPPRGRWTPSDLLIRRLTYRHLATARNCGPQTLAEILRWAQLKGRTIKPSFRAGKSLTIMWNDIIAKMSSGGVSKAEVAAALEVSTRRRNTRIPIEFQKALLELFNSSNE
ncbi:hypothetical protein [Afipia clevelandensis]|nr:hypothetical protein [Afipia clevelandensis]